MTLSFTQTINGKPNYFIEKIWSGLSHHFPYRDEDWFLDYKDSYKEKFGKTWDQTGAGIYPNEKLHTIRLDPHNRWRAGMKIHPVINNRTPQRFQFAPELECKSVQEIIIKYYNAYRKSVPDQWGPMLNLDRTIWVQVSINGAYLTVDKIKELAINDGFDSVEDFFAYFNKDFTGKLIHWSDLKY